MATGTATTNPTYDWGSVPQGGTLTYPAPDVSSDPILIPAATDPAHPGFGPLVANAWSHIDPITGTIPAGATITDITMSVQVRQSSATGADSFFPQNPYITFGPESEFVSGVPFSLGNFGAGGVGSLPLDTSTHTILYDNVVYSTTGFGSGIADMDAWVAAIASGDPLSMYVSAQNVANGQYMAFGTPWVFTIYWETTGTIQPPLRQIPRTDGLGASSAPRHYPPSRSVQASNRRAGGYL